MVSWGITTVAMAFIRTPVQFYTVRILLGAAEAGFFPGIIVYLTHWFRYEDRARAGALFMTAIPVANILGSPLAGWLLGVHWLGIPGWRWLFIVEGIPAVVFGIATLFYLTDWPRDARWLSAAERDWISSELEKEKLAKQAVRPYSIWEALKKREVIQLTAAYFFGVSSIYSLTTWLPTFLKRASGMSNLSVTSITMIPYVAVLAAMILNGWHSDRTGERRWHTVSPLLLGAACFLLAISSGAHFWLAFLCLTVAATANSFLPTFWAIPSALLSESAAAASVGLINSIGNLGSFFSPFVIGYLLDRTHSFTPGFLCTVASLFLSAFLVLMLRLPRASALRS
jgi:ACS family tartrate transporter-like MFS transporter